MVIRLRYRQLGGHVHCRVFTAPFIDHTFAKVGDLIFDEREWPTVQNLLASKIEFLPEEQAVRS